MRALNLQHDHLFFSARMNMCVRRFSLQHHVFSFIMTGMNEDLNAGSKQKPKGREPEALSVTRTHTPRRDLVTRSAIG